MYLSQRQHRAKQQSTHGKFAGLFTSELKEMNHFWFFKEYDEPLLKFKEPSHDVNEIIR